MFYAVRYDRCFFCDAAVLMDAQREVEFVDHTMINRNLCITL